MNLFTKQKETDRRQTMATTGEAGVEGGVNREGKTDVCKLLSIKQTTARHHGTEQGAVLNAV